MHFKKVRNVAINVEAFFKISPVILHSKVPVGINIDFEVLKLLLAVGLLEIPFFITISKLNAIKLYCA